MMWQTDKIKDIIKDIPNCHIVEVSGKGGDVDTEHIVIEVNGAKNDKTLWVCGFNTSNYNTLADNTEVEHIEVTTGYSDGDMPNEPALMRAHAEIKARLIEHGYTSVVDSMDVFFLNRDYVPMPSHNEIWKPIYRPPVNYEEPKDDVERCALDILVTLADVYPEVLDIDIILKKLPNQNFWTKEQVELIVELLIKTKHLVKIGYKYRIWANGWRLLESGNDFRKYPLYVAPILVASCPKCKQETQDVRETSNPNVLVAKCLTCKIKDKPLIWKFRP